MTTSSEDASAATAQLQEIALRGAKIGNGTRIQRALPSRHKRMIGAWCFLDHAGPAQFEQNDGLNVGPHPHIGLQTFTWMIEGTLMHHDSIGSEQLIRPKQVNLMTAGCGISHTEVTPKHETQLHAAQLWIALPDHLRNMPPKFQHYPDLPTIDQDALNFTILVGDYLGLESPVEVHTPLISLDIHAPSAAKTVLQLRPDFEYGILLLEGAATVEHQRLQMENMFVLSTGFNTLNIELEANSRVLLIGGEPFTPPILLWWNFVARTEAELKQANQDWIDHHPRFGNIPSYTGHRLTAPPFPAHIKSST
ncbi:pirin family protein [Acinetobacter sp. MD2(2019)]|uniref:pirin family protein n=1 Tax=Acinetobacter sp. MD2(2019) TaxID=2605273 RepID=UPI002D1E80B9|nr:pirin family protein [Acinetobacter sp. MD2(2019)]MEB3753239.1 pirin family protein [Acinetobacter sp. MD2(2019)]